MAVLVDNLGQPLLYGSTPLALTAGSGTGTPAPMPAPGAADGFGPGIYFPDTLYISGNTGSAPDTLAQGFARLSTGGPQTWTCDRLGLRFDNTSLTAYGDFNFQAATGPATITVTDGITTLTKQVSIVQRTTGCIYPGCNVIWDTSPTSFYGKQLSDPHSAGCGVSLRTGFSGGSTCGLTDPSGLVQLDPNYAGGNGGMLASTSAAWPLTAHYGAITGVVLHVAGGQTYDQPLPVWIAQEQPPAVRCTMQPVYDFLPAGSIVGAVQMFSDQRIASVQIVDGDGSLTIAPDPAMRTAVLRLTGPQTAAAGKTFRVRATSITGIVTTTAAISYDVVAGQVLASSNIAAAFSPALDNSMGTQIAPGPVAVGTVTLTGFTAPVCTVAAQDEYPLTVGNTPTGTFVATPRAGNPLLIDVTANWLSGGTYQVVVTVQEGVKYCTRTVSLTVADVCDTGPTITVSPGAAVTSTTAPTWNAALDAYWTSPANLKGLHVALPGGIYDASVHDAAGQQEFNRHTLGHGSNQQFPPGPYVLSGPSASNPTIISLNGAPGLQAQGGLIAQGGDVQFRNLILKNVSNINQAEGNAGAILKVGGLPCNLLMQDVKVYNSDNGFLSGYSEVSVFRWQRCVFALNGIGAGGLTHNFYIGHAGKVFLDQVLSISTAQVHGGKFRAREVTVTNSTFADGQNGEPGSSSCLDFPNGGLVTVSGTTLHKGPAPNNNGDMVQFAEESASDNGPAWDVNTLVLDGVTFLNTAAPGAITSSVYAINFMQGQTQPALSRTTGLPATITYRNCRFYNLPRDQWAVASAAAGGNVVIDGGGNQHLTDWPGLQAIDPSTGTVLTSAHAPNRTFGTNFVGVRGNQGILLDVLELETRIAAGAVVGTHVTQLYTSDQSGAPLTGVTWSLPADQVNVGNFAVSATGEVTVARAGLTNGLVWAKARVTGTDSQGTTQTYTKYIFVVIGTGHVPGLATAGGAVQAA